MSGIHIVLQVILLNIMFFISSTTMFLHELNVGDAT